MYNLHHMEQLFQERENERSKKLTEKSRVMVVILPFVLFFYGTNYLLS